MKLNKTLTEYALSPNQQTRTLELLACLPDNMQPAAEQLAVMALRLNLSIDAVMAAIALASPVKPAELSAHPIASQILAQALRLEGWVEATNLDSSRVDTIKNLQSLLLNEPASYEPMSLLLLWTLRQIKETQPKDRAKNLAKRGLYVYAPIADRLSLGQIKTELETQSFKILNPTQYEFIEKLLIQSGSTQSGLIKKLKMRINHQLKSAHIKVENLSGRQKHPYSIYQKMLKKTDFEKILDIVALRLIVPTTGSCYKALGVIHDIFEPVEGTLKDYIAKPKLNGYRSLHTVVKADTSQPIEIQIRTSTMHEVAEKGEAAHWHYNQTKQTKSYKKGQSSGRLSIKTRRKIYVFTPAGDLLALPTKATALDAAFYIHSAVGLRAVGAKVNNKIAKLDKPLQNGDRVEIMTQKQPRPKEDWLRFVSTKLAKNRIRTWLKAANKSLYQQLGEQLLKEEAINRKIHPHKEDLQRFVAGSRYPTKEELFIAIGSGVLPAKQVIDQLKIQITPKAPKAPTLGREPKVSIGGMSGVSYHLAACCAPLPPRPITGYLGKNLEVSVHLKGCSSLPKDSQRLIPCAWI